MKLRNQRINNAIEYCNCSDDSNRDALGSTGRGVNEGHGNGFGIGNGRMKAELGDTILKFLEWHGIELEKKMEEEKERGTDREKSNLGSGFDSGASTYSDISLSGTSENLIDTDTLTVMPSTSTTTEVDLYNESLNQTEPTNSESRTSAVTTNTSNTTAVSHDGNDCASLHQYESLLNTQSIMYDILKDLILRYILLNPNLVLITYILNELSEKICDRLDWCGAGKDGYSPLVTSLNEWDDYLPFHDNRFTRARISNGIRNDEIARIFIADVVFYMACFLATIYSCHVASQPLQSILASGKSRFRSNISLLLKVLMQTIRECGWWYITRQCQIDYSPMLGVMVIVGRRLSRMLLSFGLCVVPFFYDFVKHHFGADRDKLKASAGDIGAQIGTAVGKSVVDFLLVNAASAQDSHHTMLKGLQDVVGKTMGEEKKRDFDQFFGIAPLVCKELAICQCVFDILDTKTCGLGGCVGRCICCIASEDDQKKATEENQRKALEPAWNEMVAWYAGFGMVPLIVLAFNAVSSYGLLSCMYGLLGADTLAVVLILWGLRGIYLWQKDCSQHAKAYRSDDGKLNHFFGFPLAPLQPLKNLFCGEESGITSTGKQGFDEVKTDFRRVQGHMKIRGKVSNSGIPRRKQEGNLSDPVDLEHEKACRRGRSRKIDEKTCKKCNLPKRTKKQTMIHIVYNTLVRDVLVTCGIICALLTLGAYRFNHKVDVLIESM